MNKYYYEEKHLIKINHLSYSYQDKKVLNDISVSFPDSGFIVILGKSGSGKTTFLSLLTHVLPLKEGTIEGNERERFSYVFQSPLLLPYMDVKDNVSFPLVLKNEIDIDKKVKEVLKKVDLENYEKRDVTTLSGGEKMRVSLARSLILNKDVLILDEPTGQLDEKSSKAIYSILKEISKTKLVIMVSHDEKNSFIIADALYELEEGKLILRNENKKENSLKSIEKQEEKKGGHVSFKKAISLQYQYLKSKRKRILISSLFLVLNLALVYFSLSIKNNLPSFLTSLSKEHYGYETLKVKKKVKIAQEGHLTLERYVIPDKETREKYQMSSIYPSLDYFLPSSREISLGGKEEDCLFFPVFNHDKTRIANGRTPQNEKEVVVNSSFVSSFGGGVLERMIHFSYQVAFPVNEIEMEEIISFDYTFRIVGICKEKKLLNNPTVYYDYQSMRDYISQMKLEKTSKEYDLDVYLSSYLDVDKYAQEDYLSHEILLYLQDVPSFISSTKNDESLKVTNQALTMEISALEVTDSLLKVISLFLGLNLLGAFLSEFLVIYSLYVDNIRFFALLSVLENPRKNRRILIFALSFLFFLFDSLLLFFTVSAISVSLDSLLTRLLYPSFFHGVIFSYLILLFLLVFFVSVLSSFLALRKIKENEVKEQLEGED